MGVMGGVRDRLGQALFERVAGPDGPGQARADPRLRGAALVRRPTARSRSCTATPRCSSAASVRCCCRPCTRPRCWRSRSTPASAATCGAGCTAPASSWPPRPSAPPRTPSAPVDIVRAIHRRVVGTMPDGTPYAASDPHLLRWVHVAEVDSFLRAHTVYGKQQLDQAGRDTYVAQVGDDRRRGSAPPTCPPPRPSSPRRWRRTAPSCAAPPRPARPCATCCSGRRCRCAARAPYGVLVAAAVGLMPAWTRPPLRLPLAARSPSGPSCARSGRRRPAPSAGR